MHPVASDRKQHHCRTPPIFFKARKEVQTCHFGTGPNASVFWWLQQLQHLEDPTLVAPPFHPSHLETLKDLAWQAMSTSGITQFSLHPPFHFLSHSIESCSSVPNWNKHLLTYHLAPLKLPFVPSHPPPLVTSHFVPLSTSIHRKKNLRNAAPTLQQWTTEPLIPASSINDKKIRHAQKEKNCRLKNHTGFHDQMMMQFAQALHSLYVHERWAFALSLHVDFDTAMRQLTSLCVKLPVLNIQPGLSLGWMLLTTKAIPAPGDVPQQNMKQQQHKDCQNKLIA